MTQLAEKMLSTLPSWRKLNGPNQLMSWQLFVVDVQEQINPLASEENLRELASQLHSMGEVCVCVGVMMSRWLNMYACLNYGYIAVGIKCVWGGCTVSLIKMIIFMHYAILLHTPPLLMPHALPQNTQSLQCRTSANTFLCGSKWVGGRQQLNRGFFSLLTTHNHYNNSFTVKEGRWMSHSHQY